MFMFNGISCYTCMRITSLKLILFASIFELCSSLFKLLAFFMRIQLTNFSNMLQLYFFQKGLFRGFYSLRDQHKLIEIFLCKIFIVASTLFDMKNKMFVLFINVIRKFYICYDSFSKLYRGVTLTKVIFGQQSGWRACFGQQYELA